MTRDTYWRSVDPDWRNAVALGMVDGASLVQKLANSLGITTAGTPLTVWDLNTLHVPPSAPVSLEILSSNANDTAAGTGARTVLVDGLDANYNPQITVATMNGATPVALPGTWMAVNRTLVLTSGTFNASNIGNITTRVAGGGTAHDYIIATVGIARNSMYTVPAGKTLLMTDIYINVGKPGGSSVNVDIFIRLMQPNGASLNGNVNTLSDTQFPFFPLSTGIPIGEKTVVSFTISNASTNGINIDLSYSGVLINNGNIPPSPV